MHLTPALAGPGTSLAGPFLLTWWVSRRGHEGRVPAPSCVSWAAAPPSITVTTRASREDPHGTRALISEGTHECGIAQGANTVIRQIVTSLSVV